MEVPVPAHQESAQLEWGYPTHSTKNVTEGLDGDIENGLSLTIGSSISLRLAVSRFEMKPKDIIEVELVYPPLSDRGQYPCN